MDTHHLPSQTFSAGVISSPSTTTHQQTNSESTDTDITNRLESLCLSMTEHALNQVICGISYIIIIITIVYN